MQYYTARRDGHGKGTEVAGEINRDWPKKLQEMPDGNWEGDRDRKCFPSHLNLFAPELFF